MFTINDLPSVTCPFNHLKLRTSIKILSLYHKWFIFEWTATKDFMKYIFANLLVAFTPTQLAS